MSSGGTDLLEHALADHRAGRLAQAEAGYRLILTAEPGSAVATHLLGVVAYQTGRLAESEGLYRQALRLRPDAAEIHSNLGVTLRDLHRLPEAEACFREAIRLRPDYPEAHNNLGTTLHERGQAAEAEASCRIAVRLRPDYVEAHRNLANALRDLGRLAEAEASYRQVLSLNPDDAWSHSALGMTLRSLGRPEEAEACYRSALRLRPDYPEAHSNRGNVLCELGRLAEAEACFREALRLNPELPNAHFGLSYPLLLTGRLQQGLNEYEWRWRTKQSAWAARDFSAPRWEGETLGERVLLLHAEQGFGDTLQFCRYVPLIGAATTVVLEVQPPLRRLLSRLPGATTVVARGEPLPAFDMHCPLLSVPRVLGTTLDTIPGNTPYLFADPAEVAVWRERLASLQGLRVGLVWSGASRLDWPEVAAVDRRRSISLEMLAPLGDVAGACFISLQKGPGAVQAKSPPPGMVLHDFTHELNDFADTAALVHCLDLVISVDTAVAHLAGALGKPVWLLNRFDTCWRWLLNRDDSPWYPALRQFRQPRPGDWPAVIENVLTALRGLIAGGPAVPFTTM